MTETLSSDFGSHRRIFITAAPLMLSQTGMMIMQLVDGLYVSWHSTDAMAAIGPGMMSFYTLAALFLGVVGYSSTFVAQYVGAGRTQRVGAAVWQGVYVALAGGALIAAISLLAVPIFKMMNHAPAVMALEVTFFRIMCWAAPATLLAAAMSGFFTGRNDNLILAFAQLLGLSANAVLAYVMIFGHFGLPNMGIAGAAWAMIIGQGVIVLTLGVVYFNRKNRETYGTLKDWPLDWSLLGRLLKYGLPSGFRFLLELAVWSLFIMFMGRVGKAELAATNIAQRLNGIAFFPIIGMGMAISAMVGQAQGAKRPDLAERCVWRGLMQAEVWMLANVAMFLLVPHVLLEWFHDSSAPDAVAFDAVLKAGLIILRFVAIYCIIDAFNMILLGALQGAGDTRWTLAASAIAHVFLLGMLLTIDHFVAAGRLRHGLFWMWGLVTVFVFTYAAMWLYRFRSGKWKQMRVIEHTPADLETVNVTV